MRIVFLFYCIFFTAGIFAQNALEVTIDSIMLDAIDSMAFPGAQVLIIKEDSIVLHKPYGYHTYDNSRKVELSHLYDLASVTKVTSGLPLLMKMYEVGKFDINKKLKDYFPKFKCSNKKDATWQKILAHQARLEPYLVFWKLAQDEDGNYKKNTFDTAYSKNYPIQITDQLYLHKNYYKKMVDQIKKSPLQATEKYKYSGLMFLLMPAIISEILKTDFEPQLKVNFLDRLGADRMCYNPLKFYPLEEIVPTEIDTIFRNQLVHGTVHDEAAAMLGGVSCNAGLFSNAESLSKLFLMYMQMGKFEGGRCLKEETMKLFSSYQFADNRRGLGFDKPLLEYDAKAAYIAKSASPESFGHSGFTGTFVWADPTHNLLFILLSNRVYPYRSQRKLYNMDIRPKLHQAAYDILVGKEEE